MKVVDGNGYGRVADFLAAVPRVDLTPGIGYGEYRLPRPIRFMEGRSDAGVSYYSDFVGLCRRFLLCSTSREVDAVIREFLGPVTDEHVNSLFSKELFVCGDRDHQMWPGSLVKKVAQVRGADDAVACMETPNFMVSLAACVIDPGFSVEKHNFFWKMTN